MYECEYFKIQELVSEKVYKKFGKFAWSFFDKEILQELDEIRRFHGMPIIFHNWSSGAFFSQCGLRCNID